jgi:hypothetical protein
LLTLWMSARAQTYPCLCQLPQDSSNYYASAGGVYYTNELIISEPNRDSGIASSCSPIGVSFNGSPVSASACDGLMCYSTYDDVFGNGSPPQFPNGTIVTAKGVCTGCEIIGSGPDCTPLSAQTQPIEFVFDNSPPTVTFTQGPKNSQIISLLQPITLGGTITSVSPSTVTLFHSSTFSFVPGAGGLWQIVVDTMTLAALPLNADGSGLTTLGLYAEDILGYAVSYVEADLPDNDSPDVDPTLARQVYVDFLPPGVTFDLGTSTVRLQRFRELS